MIALSHLLILSVVLFGLWLLHRYLSGRLISSSIHCPTQLAAEGQYEAPPRGWTTLFLIIKLIVPRLIFLTAITGPYLILIFDFDFRPAISTWFSKPDWEWKLPGALAIGVLIKYEQVGQCGFRRGRREDRSQESRHIECAQPADRSPSPWGRPPSRITMKGNPRTHKS